MPPEKLLTQLAPQMKRCWNKVAYALGFQERDIKRFRSSSDGNRTGGAFAMLSEWYQNNIPTEAKEKLVQAFAGIGRGDLAEAVRRSGNNFFNIFWTHRKTGVEFGRIL